MGIPLDQALSIGAYVLKQHLTGRKRYPLVLMLEPLFRCNLACAGCGKIDYPDKILNQRISVADALHSMDECGAPVVVQSMTNTDTADIASTVKQVADLARAGSELVRITVDRDEAAKAGSQHERR